MMKRFYYILAASVLLLSGCENPMDEHGPDGGAPTNFTATIDTDEPATRTLLANVAAGSARDVLWKTGDELIIGGATYVAGTLSSDKLTATLTPKVASQLAQKVGTVYEAYYPTLIYNGGTPTLPDTQPYEAPETVGSEKFVVASHLPMYAQSETTELSFKNLCAVLNFRLTGTDKVTKVVVTSATQNLSGPFDVVEATSGAGDWYAKIKDSDPAASNQVTLNCSGVSGGGVQLDATNETEFCIAVPAADYPQNDLTVQVYGYKGSGSTEELLMPSFTNSAPTGSQLERSKIYDITKNTKIRFFEVTYQSSSPAANASISGSTISIINSDRVRLTFKVNTNMGYDVIVSDDSYFDSSNLPSATPEMRGPFTPDISVLIDNYLGEVSNNTSSFTEADFSVSATQKVHFSQGNVQYRASTDTWRFAPYQWQYVGSSSTLFSPTFSGNVYQDGVRSASELASATYDGWIDHFAWGSTGVAYGATSYQPWIWGDYPVAQNFGPPFVSVSDPDSYLQVSNGSDWGGHFGGGYRTLKAAEYEYLINARGECSYLFCHLPTPERTATITFRAQEDPSFSASFTVTRPGNPINGLILFPDNFISNYPLLVSTYDGQINTKKTYPRIGETDIWGAEITNWAELEQAGCVFLPAAGFVSRNELNGNDEFYINGRSMFYWSSSPNNYADLGRNYASSLEATTGGTSIYPQWRTARNIAASVRLVKDAAAGISAGSGGIYGGYNYSINNQRHLRLPINIEDDALKAYLTRGFWSDPVPDDAYVVYSVPTESVYIDLGDNYYEYEYVPASGPISKAGICAHNLTVNSVVVHSYTERNGNVYSVNDTYYTSSGPTPYGAFVKHAAAGYNNATGSVYDLTYQYPVAGFVYNDTRWLFVRQNAANIFGNGSNSGCIISYNGNSFYLCLELTQDVLWKDCTATLTVNFTFMGVEYSINTSASYYHQWDLRPY